MLSCLQWDILTTMNNTLTPSVFFSTSFTRQANGELMKMYLNCDEWYPVYTLREDIYKYLPSYEVELDQNLMDEYQRIMDEFDAFQEILSKLPTKKIEPTEKF